MAVKTLLPYYLPLEILGEIYSYLDLRDIANLRLTNHCFRESAVYSLSRVSAIKVSCSRDGLVGLNFIAGIVNQVEHVTIHVVTVQNLQELVKEIGPTDEDAYVEAYAKVRRELLNALRRFPKLRSVKATNENLGRATGRNFRREMTGPVNWFDPITKLRNSKGIFNTHSAPQRCYGFETVFSILPELDRDIKLNLAIDQDLIGRAASEEQRWKTLKPFALRQLSMSHEPHPEELAVMQRRMFGVNDLQTTEILKKHLHHLSLRAGDGQSLPKDLQSLPEGPENIHEHFNSLNERYWGDCFPGLNMRFYYRPWYPWVELLAEISDSPLESLTLEGFSFFGVNRFVLPESDRTLRMDADAIFFPNLTEFTICGCIFGAGITQFVSRHFLSLKDVTFGYIIDLTRRNWSTFQDFLNEWAALEEQDSLPRRMCTITLSGKRIITAREALSYNLASVQCSGLST